LLPPPPPPPHAEDINPLYKDFLNKDFSSFVLAGPWDCFLVISIPQNTIPYRGIGMSRSFLFVEKRITEKQRFFVVIAHKYQWFFISGGFTMELCSVCRLMALSLNLYARRKRKNDKNTESCNGGNF
jgi:hypothetical protein